MTDEIEKEDEQARSAQGPVDDLAQAGAAEDQEAAEASIEASTEAATEAWEAGEDLPLEGEGDADVGAALAEAHRASLNARAWWSLVHGELLVLLFANCLFFAGVLAAWDRPLPWDEGVVRTFNGLDTIRGAAIFALSIYGFWVAAFNIWYRQLRIWPYMLSALLALWVGLGGFVNTVGSSRWTGASTWLETQTTSMLTVVLAPLSSVAPGFWLLTAGGVIVLIMLLKGIMSGRAKAKAAQREGGGTGGGRRRRR